MFSLGSTMETWAEKSNHIEQEKLTQKKSIFDIQKKNCERKISGEQRAMVTKLHKKLQQINHLETENNKFLLVRKRSEPLQSITIDEQLKCLTPNIKRRSGGILDSPLNRRFNFRKSGLTMTQLKNFEHSNVKLHFPEIRSAESSPMVLRSNLKIRDIEQLREQLTTPTSKALARTMSAETLLPHQPDELVDTRRSLSDNLVLPTVNVSPRQTRPKVLRKHSEPIKRRGSTILEECDETQDDQSICIQKLRSRSLTEARNQETIDDKMERFLNSIEVMRI